MGNGRILGEIAASENDKPPNFASDAERFFPMKVFCSPFRTEPPQLIERILTTPGGAQGLFINIGRIDLYIIILDSRSKVLSQQHGDRVRLLAAGATRAPCAKGMSRLDLLQQ